MIAVFVHESQSRPVVHAVLSVARESFATVRTRGFCPAYGNAADGVYQIPEWAFDGRATIQLPGMQAPWHVCERCASALKTLRDPPPSR